MFRSPTALLLASGVLLSAAVSAQTTPNPTQQAIAASRDEVPVFRITVVGRTTPAINYRPRRGDIFQIRVLEPNKLPARIELENRFGGSVFAAISSIKFIDWPEL